MGRGRWRGRPHCCTVYIYILSVMLFSDIKKKNSMYHQVLYTHNVPTVEKIYYYILRARIYITRQVVTSYMKINAHDVMYDAIRN